MPKYQLDPIEIVGAINFESADPRKIQVFRASGARERSESRHLRGGTTRPIYT